MSPSWHPKRCRVAGCNAPSGAISKRGYCIDHGVARMEANNRQISAHRGEFFERWYEANRRVFEHPRWLDATSERD